MKKLKVLLGFLLGITCMAWGQNIHFLNYSICNPSSMNSLEVTNEYMQGGGHNMYLSYSLDAQSGSFSETEFAYGTEENPMIIRVDTVDGKPQKKYYKQPVGELYAGIRGDDMWISESLWEGYTEENDPLIGDDLPYENDAFQCARNAKREDEGKDRIEADSGKSNYEDEEILNY